MAIVEEKFVINHDTPLGEALDKYTEFTRTTAIYPGAKSGSPIEILYLGCGLAGEVAELEYLSASAGREFKAELSDVLWYIMRIIDALAENMEQWTWEIVEGEPSFMAIYDELSDATTASWRFAIEDGRLCIGAGNLCNKLKKLARDGVSPTKTRECFVLATQFLCMLYGAANKNGYSLDEIMRVNIDKLTSRKDRGVLCGDGGDR